MVSIINPGNSRTLVQRNLLKNPAPRRYFISSSVIKKCGDDCQKSLSKDNLLLQGNVCIAFLHESSVPYKCLLLSREDVCCKKKRKKIFAVLAKIAH